MNRSTKAEWRRTSIQGLYEFRPHGTPETERGVYYARFSVNGIRTFRSHETSVFEHAKIKHAKLMVDVEKDRRRGADLGTGFKTLGALLAEVENRLNAIEVRPNTAVGRRNNIARLKTHWRRGNFDTFLARNVTAEVITELRDYLLKEAPWRYHFGRTRRGFNGDVVNMTLWVLKVIMDLAVEKMVVIENPFRVASVLQPRLTAGRQGSRKRAEAGPRRAIPSRPDMMRILAEMRRVPENSERFRPNPEQRRYLESQAQEMADFAELMAFSGMRKGEARKAAVADDLGEEFKIHGTKSESSERTIPVNPMLRAVLDRIKCRRIGPRSSLVVTWEPGIALKRACRRLDLPPLRNHDLRHFFASACIASGVDVPTVSRWLGHADGGALAMKTYGHLLRDHSLAAAKRVDFTGNGSAVREIPA